MGLDQPEWGCIDAYDGDGCCVDDDYEKPSLGAKQWKGWNKMMTMMVIMMMVVMQGLKYWENWLMHE